MSDLNDIQRMDWLEKNIDDPKRLKRYMGSSKMFTEIENDDFDSLAVGATLRDALDELIEADDTFKPLDATLMLKGHALQLVERAAALGLVLTVEQVPLLPLAMGHHKTVVSVRPARSPA